MAGGATDPLSFKEFVTLGKLGKIRKAKDNSAPPYRSPLENGISCGYSLADIAAYYLVTAVNETGVLFLGYFRYLDDLTHIKGVDIAKVETLRGRSWYEGVSRRDYKHFEKIALRDSPWYE